MKIDLNSIDRTQFLVHEHIVAGEPCFLVQPQHIGAEWTPENIIFRSSLWNARGEPVSLSWKKHFNWDEKPNIDPAPENLDEVELIEKIDGSTLLISAYKGELIVRSRGTVDATILNNGDEIELFKKRYPSLFKATNLQTHRISGNNDYITVVCEWVSPRNQIVIPYNEPELYLTGIINHKDYSYWSQSELDHAANFMNIKRPRRYKFDTISEMINTVDAFQGIEGICAYYNQGQSWRKVKAAQYLILHRFKERVTPSNLLDLFFAYGKPNQEAFLERIEKEFDWECRDMAKKIVIDICEAYHKVVVRHFQIAQEIEHLRGVPRRDAAAHILKNYSGYEKGCAFNILDNKETEIRVLRNLMEEAMNKS